MLPFELTKDTPYLALSGELLGVFYEYFNRNWSCYKGFLMCACGILVPDTAIIFLLCLFFNNFFVSFQGRMGMPGFAGVNGIPVSMDIIYIISYIDCSVQDFSNSNANALELQQSCT